MKPPPFAYVKPATLAEACAVLERHGEAARILAGGQSLMASLNLRLSAPDLLVDIGGLGGLSGIVLDGPRLRIGALTRHCEIEASELVRRHAPLLAQAMPHIAHPAIRNRGTIGGSLAFADPAAELPACVVALAAAIEIAGRGTTRRVAAEDFFRGLYETALGPGEVLTAVEIPVLGAGERSFFAELARRRGDYAMAGLAAHGCFAGERVAALRLAFFALGPQPVRARHAEAALAGRPLDETAIAAARAALARDLAPASDLQAGAAMKLHLAGVLTGRVLTALAAGGES